MYERLGVQFIAACPTEVNNTNIDIKYRLMLYYYTINNYYTCR